MNINRVMCFKNNHLTSSVSCKNLKECMDTVKANLANIDIFVIIDDISSSRKPGKAPIVAEVRPNGHIDWRRECTV